MIIHKSFKHGWFYHYRLHTPNTSRLCNSKFSSLNEYLNSLFESCPDDYFNKIRSSSLKIPLDFDVKEINHPITLFAKEALEMKEKSAHTRVQLHMLNKDSGTLAVEVPLWLKNKELFNHEKIFNSDEFLSGHIDVLRIEDNKIWVWDFKPRAHLEKYADTQTFFYSLMLSQRTNIPLDNFRCGYFDENSAFAFKPEITKIDELLN